MSSQVISFKMIWECLGELNELGERNKGLTGIERNEIAVNFAKKKYVSALGFCETSKENKRII